MRKEAVQTEFHRGDQRWLALIAISFGSLMIVLDATIVYVALPSIKEDLKLSDTSAVWIANAFTLPLSGFLLLGGRLGDLYGHRKVFLIGIGAFTLASLICGWAHILSVLIAGRIVQGSSGALVSAVTLSIITEIFSDTAQRTKALGVISFIAVGGGSIGLLLGGVLTSALNWHWIFLVNLPIGLAVYVACRSWVPASHTKSAAAKLDFWGAVTVTAALVIVVYVVLNGDRAGWLSGQTIGLLSCALVLFTLFLILESRVSMPLIPLRFFGLRNVMVSNAVRMLWGAATSASLFVALYVQIVLGLGPMEVGLTFLPGNLVLAAFSLSLSGKLITQFGINRPLTIGLALAAVGLMLFAQMPVNGDILKHVFPGTILLAISTGMASTPLLLVTLLAATPREIGLTAGVVGTISVMSGALGLAIFASLASARTNHLLAAGASQLVALTAGYRLAFLVAAACATAAALISATCLPRDVKDLSS